MTYKKISFKLKIKPSFKYCFRLKRFYKVHYIFNKSKLFTSLSYKVFPKPFFNKTTFLTNECFKLSKTTYFGYSLYYFSGKKGFWVLLKYISFFKIKRLLGFMNVYLEGYQVFYFYLCLFTDVFFSWESSTLFTNFYLLNSFLLWERRQLLWWVRLSSKVYYSFYLLGEGPVFKRLKYFSLNKLTIYRKGRLLNVKWCRNLFINKLPGFSLVKNPYNKIGSYYSFDVKEYTSIWGSYSISVNINYSVKF